MEQLQINNNFNFNIGKYISSGIDLFRKDPSGILTAFLLVIVMSIIPFCSILAIGNFYKVCRDVEINGKADTGKIFNFDDFVPYLKFIFLLFAVVFITIIPIPIFIFPLSMFTGEDGSVSDVGAALVAGGFGLFMLFYVIFMITLSIATYYFIPLVALKGSHAVRKNISTSWMLAKKDFFSIFVFIIISGILSQIGIFACGIGLFFTIPIGLCMRYKSFEKINNL